MNDKLPGNVMDLITAQFASIAYDHDQVKVLYDAAEAVAEKTAFKAAG